MIATLPPRDHRFPASLQDLDGPLVVPVVQDELQEVEVGRRHRLEEVAANHRSAFGRPALRDLGRRVVDDVGPIEDDPVQFRVGILQELE